VSRRVWKIVETEAEKAGVTEAERRSEEAREGEKEKEKTIKGENNGSKEDSRGIEDLG